ncbi:hypothetical protein EMIT0P253_40165 [Pseudomonas sp. IT-P253]
MWTRSLVRKEHSKAPSPCSGDGRFSAMKKPAKSGFFYIRLLPQKLQLFNGTYLILVDAGAFAIQLFEFVETRILIVLGRVDSLDFSTIIQGNHCRRCATGEGGEAQREHESAEGPMCHECVSEYEFLWLLSLRRVQRVQVPSCVSLTQCCEYLIVLAY